ncbi:MAG: DUF4251 domain-containing protein [Bacteroidetes bacterium]|nr:DUF4251 domain-containing protein [Bacteroidota bacterium]
MKTPGLIIATILLTTGLFAQEANSNQQPSKKERRKAEIEANFQKTTGILASRQFVIEADWLGNGKGDRISVPSNLNFISVDSSNAVIQTGNNSRMGLNGVGGITARGTLSGWVMNSFEKRKTNSIKLNVLSPNGIYTIFLDVEASGYATATLSGNTSGRLLFYGKIVPLGQSGTYTGSGY